MFAEKHLEKATLAEKSLNGALLPRTTTLIHLILNLPLMFNSYF